MEPATMKTVLTTLNAVLLLAVSSVACAQSAPAPAPSAPAKASPETRVDQRIKSLHDRLKITAAQETQWATIAKTMRDSTDTVETLVRGRRAKAAQMNAVDDLRSYQAIADAHAAGIAKLVSAFEPLYKSMPPDQQKNADEVFRRPAPRSAAEKSSK
jgi:hypothetical protein